MIKITNNLENSIKGIMWGLALGDALGKPVEFLHLRQIKEIVKEVEESGKIEFCNAIDTAVKALNMQNTDDTIK